MGIKRYDLELIEPYGYGEASHMVQQDDGDWVDHDDHLAALREQRLDIEHLLDTCRLLWYDLKGVEIPPSAKQHLDEMRKTITAFEPGKEDGEDG